MIKYLFSDVDGTLYVNDKVSKDDVDAVHKFVESGGVFSIATGRTDFEIINFAAEEQFPIPTHRVSANGAMVVAEEEEIFHIPFTKKAKQIIYDFLKEHTNEIKMIEISTDDFVYFYGEPEGWELKYKGTQFEVHEETLEHLLKDDFNVLKIFILGTEEVISKLDQLIMNEFSHELSVFNDGSEVNIVSNQVHKGIGIQQILENYNIEPHEIAVIGDAANDIGMFQITPHSFTFTYAQDFVKEHANYVVENVAEAIDYIMNKTNQGGMK